MNVQDGGPAFPVSEYSHEDGMTLRDYFAAQALEGILAGDTAQEIRFEERERVSGCCYAWADAMLKARNG